MEKKLTNSGPFRESTRKHSIYPPSWFALHTQYREAFLHALRERGWVEGQNMVIQYRYAEGSYERLPALATELVQLKVDVIFAPSAPATQAVRQAWIGNADGLFASAYHLGASSVLYGYFGSGRGTAPCRYATLWDRVSLYGALMRGSSGHTRPGAPELSRSRYGPKQSPGHA